MKNFRYAKSFFQILPDLNGEDRPERIKNPSTRGLVLIPLYDGHYSNDQVTHGLAQAAAWARRSWSLYSDASDYGIDIKLYVENRIAGQISNILQTNGLFGDRVIWFDGDHIEGALKKHGRYSTFGAKKLMMLTDSRLADYDWIFCVDSDLFVMNYDRNERLPFFSEFFKLADPKSPAFWYARYLTNVPDHSPVTFNYYRNADNHTTPESIAAFEKRVEPLVGREILTALRDGKMFLTCSGCITAFPAKHFMSECYDECEYLVALARATASGEIPFILWSMQGNPLTDLTPLPFPMLAVADGMPVDFYESFLEATNVGRPFLLHYASSPVYERFINAITN